MAVPEQENEQGVARDPSVVLRKATGPRTSAGKERSRRNSEKHGIFSDVALVKGESRLQFERLLSGLRECRRPEGMLEEALVEKADIDLWRYRRFLKAEANDIQRSGALTDTGFLEVPTHYSILDHQDNLLRYAASLERSFDRTLSQLERLQRMRLGQPVLPKLEVHHSIT